MSVLRPGPASRSSLVRMAQQVVRSSSLWSTPTPYRRIRLLRRPDIEQTYPLIASYMDRPELALSVQELVLDANSWPSTSGLLGGGLRELSEPALPVREDSHAAIRAYVENMGLAEKSTRAMLQALDWKKQHLKGERPESPDGFDAHNSQYAYAAATILLSLCANLTTLYVHGVGWESPVQELLLKSNYGLLPRPALQQLRDVEIIQDGGSWSDDSYDAIEILQYAGYFHRLPSISALSMEGIQEYQAERHVFPPGTGNIKKIHIGHSDVSGELLGTIIRMPKALEEFSFSLGGLFSRDGGMPLVPPRTLGKSLLTQKGSLKVLDIDIDNALHSPGRRGEDELEQDEAPGGEDEEPPEGLGDEYLRMDYATSNGPLFIGRYPDTRRYGDTIGSLHDFTALTHLTLSVKLLLGPASGSTEGPPGLAREPPFRLIDALPPSLEYFCLRGYKKGEKADVDDHVKEFVEQKAQRLPHLREVRGIDEFIPSLEESYPEWMDEDTTWHRPERDLDWEEA